jgi:hypothetical protein
MISDAFPPLRLFQQSFWIQLAVFVEHSLAAWAQKTASLIFFFFCVEGRF